MFFSSLHSVLGCYVKSWSLKPFLLSSNLVCLFVSMCVCCLCSCVVRVSIMTHWAAMKHSFQQMSPSLLLPNSLSKVWVSICAYIRCIRNGVYSCHQFLWGSVGMRAVCVCVCACRRRCEEQRRWQRFRLTAEARALKSEHPSTCLCLILSPTPFPYIPGLSSGLCVQAVCLSAGSTPGCKHSV